MFRFAAGTEHHNPIFITLGDLSNTMTLSQGRSHRACGLCKYCWKIFRQFFGEIDTISLGDIRSNVLRLLFEHLDGVKSVEEREDQIISQNFVTYLVYIIFYEVLTNTWTGNNYQKGQIQSMSELLAQSGPK